MLLQFSCENYWSIKENCILSLEPAAYIEHPENIIQKDKYKALNLAAIYGANASGKSGLHHALTMAIRILRSSNIRQVGQLIPVAPFKLDEISRNKPCKFEFQFIADDNHKYVYGFSVTAEEVVEEYLYYYKTSKPSMIFERSKNEFKFSRGERKNLEAVVKMNTSNKLFLATATNWNVECTSIPYRWFVNSIDTYTSDQELTFIAMGMYENDAEKYIDFAKELMQKADINISEIHIEKKKVPFNAALPFIVPINANENGMAVQEGTEFKITTSHITIDKDNSEHIYQLVLGEESLGTQQLFYFAPFLKHTLEKGGVLFIDELDRSMHPLIVKYIVDIFRSKDTNPNGAQLMFTTHETTLLSLDTFRRDQIYFTEKNAKSGETILYSLDEFAVRKTDNIEKGYLLGRYGAIPYLQTEELM